MREPLTDDEAHHLTFVHRTGDILGYDRCAQDGERWPCDVKRLLDERKALRTERDQLRQIVSTECPIGGLSIVDSLRVEAQHRMEHVAALEAETERLKVKLSQALGEVAAYRFAGPCTEAEFAEAKTVLAERDAARAILAEVEWHDTKMTENRLIGACPVCLGWETIGHRSDCSLRAALSAQPQDGEAGDA